MTPDGTVVAEADDLVEALGISKGLMGSYRELHLKRGPIFLGMRTHKLLGKPGKQFSRYACPAGDGQEDCDVPPRRWRMPAL